MASSSITSSTGPLDVQGLVSQLMNVAKQPLNRMNQQVSTYSSQISDLGALSSDLTAFQGTLSSLSSGQFINTFKATSSNTAVLTATATSSANPGIYNVTVNNLATAQNLAFTGLANETASLGNSADTLTFTFGDGKTATVALAANSSLDQISNSINSAGIGVSASVVKADNSATPYRLVLTGNSVGADKAFSTSTSGGQAALSFMSFNAAAAVDGTGKITDNRLTASAMDASLVVNGLTLTSSSNTVTSAINGVTLNLTQSGATTMTVASDSAAIQAKVQGFVDAYNKVANDTSILYKGDLKGDYTLVNLQTELVKILNTPISGADGSNTIAYLAQAGISLQKDGKLKLDATALNTAITNNPTAVTNLFGNSNQDGFAQRFNSTINNFLGPTGLVTTRTNTLNSQSKAVKDKVDQEKTRMDIVQAGYLALYTKLNSSLMRMQQTSTSLTSMLSSMTANK
ncbi:flagellar filament capping protein FliD [Paludibacterium purpuratum]|uniref:Flagellar hook-associated protein 2 n=1 Tax=Paludibacterium purpuratum TaxID=1144873 RepID=A0A4R7B3R1_9NEIS|nr:flagellar filament capping protein FliD [Paludibacterium purpuratum]TDR78452.1 flagellar hook-associated protein 2 [Paludibacterium purpuratum]